MILMGIDPGGTTGIAYRIQIESEFHYITTNEANKKELYELILEQKPDLVLVEQFATWQINHHGLHTVELVGGIEAICWTNNIRVVRRTPQHRYPGIARAVAILDATGKKYTEHQKSALAHIFSWERSLATSNSA